jgi:hypothetical protein
MEHILQSCPSPGNLNRHIFTATNHSSYLEVFVNDERNFNDLKRDTIFYVAYYGPKDKYEIVFILVHAEVPGAVPDNWTWPEIKQVVLQYTQIKKLTQLAVITDQNDKLIYRAAGSYIESYHRSNVDCGLHIPGNTSVKRISELWEVGF